MIPGAAIDEPAPANEQSSEPASAAGSKLTPAPAHGPELAVEAGDFGGGLWFHEPVKRPDLLNPVVLAYIGDAVFELLVRQYLVALPNHKPHHLHRQATRVVSAKAQRALLEKWQPMLTGAEAEIVRRGRNAKSGAPPKNADPADYRHATALECLVGYLYYTRKIGRLRELMAAAFNDMPAEARTTKED